MVLVAEVLDGGELFFVQVVGLKFLDSVFLVLHPQDAVAVEVEGHVDFGDLELAVGAHFVFVDVNFVQVVLLLFQLGG